MTAPVPDGHVRLTPRAEAAFQREAERVGGYAIDPDEAVRATSAANFLADVELVLVAVRA